MVENAESDETTLNIEEINYG